MTWAVLSYCISLALLAGYALIYTRLDGFRKWIFIPVFLSLMGFSLFGFVQSLGYPLPLWAQLDKKDISVTSFIIDERSGVVYIWGFLEDSNIPVSLEMEFNKETAQQLYKAEAEAKGEGEEGEGGGFIEGTIGSNGSYDFHSNPPIRNEQKD